jgi:alanine racemase
LAAVRHNVAVLAERAAGAGVMAVVKADGYGHGLVQTGKAAVEGGASWLGVAFLEEALALRAAAIDVPILAWLTAPDEDLRPAVTAGIDLGIYSRTELAAAAAAARATNVTAKLQLKADTGLSRGGAPVSDWPDLCEAAAKAEADGGVKVTGIWSHFAFADGGPDHPTNSRQTKVFREALDIAASAGLRPEVRHLANSAATLTAPATHFDLVRPGLAVYGLSPIPAVSSPQELGLRPAMTLASTVALTKQVPAGAGVSYLHRYTTQQDTTLALVPLGYADGIARNATNTAQVQVGGKRRTIAGTVCMDQFVLDVGADNVRAGDEVVVFGPGTSGEPTAQDWADWLGTINYEIVTRVGARVPRTYVEESG